MATNILKIQIRNLHKTEAEWMAENPVLGPGVIAYSTDMGDAYKLGNGISRWNDLLYNEAYLHSKTVHAPADAQKNQNAFSNVFVDNTTIAADKESDTLEILSGENISTTVNGKKVTISAGDNKVANTVKNEDEIAYVTGITNNNESAQTQVYDENVYLDKKTGQLNATSYSISNEVELIFDSGIHALRIVFKNA